jgi:ABC-type lipoprotein release transport system permease subunit
MFTHPTLPIVMLGVSMLSCVVPTRRALDIEPTIALRTE